MIALLAACLAMQGCLLFTDPVNEKPKIKVLPPSSSVARGKTVTIPADASDPDGSPPRVEWSTAPGPCMPPIDAAHRPPTTFVSPPGTAEFMFTFPADEQEMVCVWAMAVDAQGATAFDAEEVSSQNQPPVAAIKVLAPTTKTPSGRYPLYSYFHLSAGDSFDPDGDKLVNPQWTLVGIPPVAAPTPKLMPCPGPTPNDFVQCLDVGAFSGDYTIELTVSDGSLPSAPASVRLTVDYDHPACVAAAAPQPDTSPIVLDPAESKTFAITSILDDGAPLPAPVDGAYAKPTFAWNVRRNNGAWQAIVGYDGINAFTLPGGSYATGDTVGISVTISDGMATHLQPTCDPQCPAGCPQSAQWTVEYR